MTTKKNLVNLMLMSIVTVATISFTACSDDLDSEQLTCDGSQENVTRGELLEPIALIYTDFNSASDVQILTADTTKALLMLILVVSAVRIWTSLAELKSV